MSERREVSFAASFDVQKVLALIALRNIKLHQLKSVTIGVLLGFGSFLLVIGLTLLLNIERAMETSITQSLAGHIQLYSNKAKDDLALFGGGFMGREDVGTIADFGELRKSLLEMPEVLGVMPLGIDTAIIPKGNTMDELFDQLRHALKGNNLTNTREVIERTRYQISKLHAELDAGKRISGSTGEAALQLDLLKKSEEEAFWSDLPKSVDSSMEFLETKIAPMAGQQVPLYMRYVGIDPQNFPTLFPKFKIFSGKNIPAGARGLLLSKKVNEDFFKNFAARLFDKLEKKRISSKDALLKDDEAKRFMADLPRQYQTILLHLNGAEISHLLPKIKSLMGSEFPASGKIADVLKEFLKVTNKNFDLRYRFFYDEIAPKIDLYPLKPGDTAIMRAYTRSGYVRTIPVKVYGIFGFDGLENSDLSGGFSLVDLVTFRDLFGVVDASAVNENKEILEKSAIKPLNSSDAELELFGNSAEVQPRGATPPLSELKVKKSEHRPVSFKPKPSENFDPSQLESGLALSMAVVLKPGEKISTALEKIKPLAAKWELKAVDWKEASGIVGQFATIVRAVLIIGVSVVLLVALLIINNSLIVSTLERVKEIGTMRAIGAQRSFVRSLFLWETGAIAFVGAVAGTLLALFLILFLQRIGIPAGHPVVEFLFSGARLYPTVSTTVLFLVPLVVIILSVGCSFYAANYASKISPADAMQEKE